MDRKANQYKIRLATKDKQLRKTIERLEKICVLQWWVSKSLAFIAQYEKTLEDLDKSSDKGERGILIERCEALLTSSISLYLRCFQDQPSYHLKITDVTSDRRLKNFFKSIKDLRDHEFVHWKGWRSSMTVSFNMTATSPSEITISNRFNIGLNDKMGVDCNSTYKELLQVTANYLQAQVDKSFSSVTSRIKDHSVIKKTRFIDVESGKDLVTGPRK
ncbi:MAG: hypothetical protein ACOH5I_26145 [Oligoflexus sp.]